MSIKVSNQAKKEFLTHILNTYTFKDVEDIRILKLIVESETLLNLTSIVTTNENAKRYLELGTTCSETNFLFTKGKVSTTNSMKAYHDLRMDQKTALDLNISYSAKHLDPNFYLVKEDRENEYPKKLQVADKIRAENLVNHYLIKREKENEEKQINAALDRRDFKALKKIMNKKQE